MTVSVIIPTAGRPALLGQLLASLREQIFERRFEIIVIDDGGTVYPDLDPNQLPLDGFPGEVRILRGEGKGPARARNLGAECAKGAYLLFLDDDAVVDRFYLQRVVSELEIRPGFAIAGMQRSINRTNPVALAGEWLLETFIRDESLSAPLARFAPSNGLALRRKEFEQCGGFDPRFPLAAGEDREFCRRWISCGFHIAVLDEAAIWHHFPDRVGALLQQQWRYGRGTFHFQARSGEPLKIRRAGFYWRMLRRAPTHYGPTKGVLAGLLAWLSQATIAGGYLWERLSPSATSYAQVAEVEEARVE